MAGRSLNKVQLIGNLTRDPELRYTPQGTAVCTFGLATNRSWVTDTGEKKEDTEFHRLVAWNKLAELCAQLLFKGRRVYVEGRLQTRAWTAQDGTQRQSTEIVIGDMMILDSRRVAEEGVGVEGLAGGEAAVPEVVVPEVEAKEAKAVGEQSVQSTPKKSSKGKEPQENGEEFKAEDIPF